MSCRVLLLASLCALLAACGGEADDGPGAGGENGAGGAQAPGTEATRGEAPLPGRGKRGRAEGNERARDWPTLARDGAGRAWLAMQVWDGTADQVLVVPARGWSQGDRDGLVVHRSGTRLFGTALGRDGQGRLRVVWCEQVPGGFDLWEALVDPGPEDGAPTLAGSPERLAGGEGRRCLSPVLADDGHGTLVLAWQQVEASGAVAIQARVHAQGVWGPAQAVSPGTFGVWSPAVVALGPGRFAVAFDRTVDGDADVLVSTLGLEQGLPPRLRLDETVRVTGTDDDAPGRFEVHPSLAVRDEVLYVAYEVGPERWGREGSVNTLEEALHVQRQVEIVALTQGRVHPLAQPLGAALNPNLADGVERPRLVVDDGGSLVVFFRGLPLPGELEDPENPVFQQHVASRQGGGVGWRTSIWFSYVSRLDASLGRWGSPMRIAPQSALDGSNGRCDAPIAAVGAEGAVVWAVVGDGREREKYATRSGEAGFVDDLNWWRPVSLAATDVTVGGFGARASAAAPALAPGRDLWPVRAPSPADVPPGHERTLSDGRTVRLALGDLHRHTDLSRCSSNWDGPFEDAFRYASDAGGLQFVAVTDHLEHMTRYDWWRSLTWMDAMDRPGRTVSLRAYERADALTGHRNVISGDGTLPLVGYRNTYMKGRDDAEAATPRDLWPLLAGEPILTIPHTPAGMSRLNASGLDWLGFDPEFDRVVELHQGYRGSSEAAGAPRAIQDADPLRMVRTALDGGLHFGVISSSDHQSSYGAFAGAWTTGTTREQVFEALHSRRTFASTARMALWHTWHGHAMGVSARVAAGPTDGLRVEVDVLGRELEMLELIVDGQVVVTEEVSGATADHLFTGSSLDVPATGTTYAYVRVRTTDGELGWTSPTRLGDAGWTGPDGPLGDRAFDEATGRALEVQVDDGTGKRVPWDQATPWQGPDDGSR